MRILLIMLLPIYLFAQIGHDANKDRQLVAEAKAISLGVSEPNDFRDSMRLILLANDGDSICQHPKDWRILERTREIESDSYIVGSEHIRILVHPPVTYTKYHCRACKNTYYFKEELKYEVLWTDCPEKINWDSIAIEAEKSLNRRYESKD